MEERLKKVRKALGFSQRDFAKELKVAQGTYSLFETGQRVIQPRYIEILRMKFSVNPEWLETGEGDMFLQSEDEDEIVKKFLELNEANKELVKNFVEMLINKQG